MWVSNGAHVCSLKCTGSHMKTVKETRQITLKIYSISPSVSHILSFQHMVNADETFGILYVRPPVGSLPGP